MKLDLVYKLGFTTYNLVRILPWCFIWILIGESYELFVYINSGHAFTKKKALIIELRLIVSQA